MVFTATVFDHTQFIDGFAKADKTIVIRDDLLLEIANEVQASAIIFTLENYLVTKITSQGYSIEFTQVGRKYTITNDQTNRIMYIYWEEEIKEMIRHILRYGFCAIRYNEMASTDDAKQFKPRTMDPVAEYSVRFRINDDGSREYLAYERSKLIQDKPIPNSRVFVAYPPEADGTLNSPLQKCLPEVQRLRSYWDRNEQQDFRNTHPLFIYHVESKNEGLIPNNMPEGAVAEYDTLKTNSMAPHGLKPDQLKTMYSYEIGDLFAQQQFNQEVTNGVEPDDIYRKVWNKDIRRFTDVPMSHPFRPEKLLAQNHRLATGIPQPKNVQNFDAITESLVRSISNCYGVPSEVLEGGKGQFSANVQFSTQQLNSTIQSHQRVLERFIVQMYLDIHVDDHLELMEKVFLEMNRSRVRSERAKNTETPAKKPDDKSRTKKRSLNNLLLTEEDRFTLERTITIEVHFNVNPSFDFETLKMYKDEFVISLEDFQRIALTLLPLPQHMAMNPAEVEKAVKQEAKRQKMLAPEPKATAAPKPSRPKAAAAKPSKPKTASGGGKDKK